MVTLERIEPIEQAFARLRAAPLEAAGDEQIRIYENAVMRITDFFPDELNLTALYVLKPQLKLLRDLRAELIRRYDIDVLRLSAVLQLRTHDGQLFGMAPPFVEIYEEEVQIVPFPGDREPPPPFLMKVPVLKDGMHRAWLAREENIPIRCVVVHGALRYGTYAYPNQWSQVHVHDEKPAQKKYYRRQKQYSYMRPLSALRGTKAEWDR
jgi:hypothetical protein